MKKSLVSVALCATFLNAGVFSVDISNTTQGSNFNDNYESIADALDSFDADLLRSRISYNETDALVGLLNFRGLGMSLDYAANSTLLTLRVDAIGLNETFSGATREDSVNALEDWLKKNGASAVEQIMKKLAEVSPSDPIAGNPNSIMSTTVSGDFTTGFMNVATKQQSSTTSSSANSVMIAPSYSSFDVDGVKSHSYTLPIAYSFNFDRNINEKITISLPVSYIEVEGSKSASLGFGLAYSRPINNQWTLTPAIGYGITGSADLGSLAQVASGSLTSSYKLDLGNDYALSMGNMVGYYSTVKFYNGDYAYDPGIANTVYRNALMLNIPTNSIISNTSLEVFAIDTRYTGTALYLEEYQEYGLSYGYDVIDFSMLSDNLKYSIRKNLKVGASYLSSSKAEGFKVNFGFMF